MDPDLFILADKGGHHDAHTIVQDRRLEAVGGGLAAHHRLGLDDFAFHLLRELHRQGLLAVILDCGGHAILQERAPVAQKVGVDFGLLIGFAVHEDQLAIGFIQELLVLVVQPDLFHLVFRPEAFVQLAPVAQVLEFHLGKGPALAGLDVIHLHGGPQTIVVFQNESGPDFVAVDPGHEGETFTKG